MIIETSAAIRSMKTKGFVEGVDRVGLSSAISDHQQSWGYEDGPWKGPGPGPALLMAADSIHKPPASIRFAPIKHALAVTVEPFKFSPA